MSGAQCQQPPQGIDRLKSGHSPSTSTPSSMRTPDGDSTAVNGAGDRSIAQPISSTASRCNDFVGDSPGSIVPPMPPIPMTVVPSGPRSPLVGFAHFENETILPEEDAAGASEFAQVTQFTARQIDHHPAVSTPMMDLRSAFIDQWENGCRGPDNLIAGHSTGTIKDPLNIFTVLKVNSLVCAGSSELWVCW